MSNANPIPTPETLLHQVARWLSLHMGINAAPTYLTFPRGVGFAEPAFGGDRDYSDREMLWHGPLAADGLPTGTGGAWVGVTIEPVPEPAGGIDTPTRVLGVRFWCEADRREKAVEVLADIARVLCLPGYAGGRRFVYAQAGMSADALAAMGGTPIGLIGVPPPATIGAAGAGLWRVLSVMEYAPIQVVSDAIGAANSGGVPSASGNVAVTMTLAVMVTPATLAVPSLAFAATYPLGDHGSLGDKDAAVRVARLPDGSVRGESATITGGNHGYANHAGATVGLIATSLSGGGWTISSASAAALARPSSDLVLMDWRRARTTTGEGGSAIVAGFYVHGVAAPGGGA